MGRIPAKARGRVIRCKCASHSRIPLKDSCSMSNSRIFSSHAKRSRSSGYSARVKTSLSAKNPLRWAFFYYFFSFSIRLGSHISQLGSLVIQLASLEIQLASLKIQLGSLTVQLGSLIVQLGSLVVQLGSL